MFIGGYADEYSETDQIGMDEYNEMDWSGRDLGREDNR